VSVLALVLWTFAVVLLLFGLVFVALGRNSERSYWSQRDPSGDPAHDATPLSTIVRRAGHYATGEYRAPLRITAIGVLMCWIAVGMGILAVLATWLG
jgi:hypothetical protein